MQKIEFYNNLYCLYITKHNLHKSVMSNVPVVFFTLTDIERFWFFMSCIGNNYKRFFMSPNETIQVGSVEVKPNTVAVVLAPMSTEEMTLLKKKLFDALLCVAYVSEEVMAELLRGSNIRLNHWLMSNTFKLPPANQQHLAMILCNEVRVDPDTLPGVVSVANAKLAIKHAFCCMVWGASNLFTAIVKTV